MSGALFKTGRHFCAKIPTLLSVITQVTARIYNSHVSADGEVKFSPRSTFTQMSDFAEWPQDGASRSESSDRVPHVLHRSFQPSVPSLTGSNHAQPSSLIDLEAVRPNPTARVRINYCRNDVACSPESLKVQVCPGVAAVDGHEYYSLLTGVDCINPDYDDAVSNSAPKAFPGFQMYNVQTDSKCGIKTALYSRSFPIPDSAKNLPTSAWKIADWFNGGTLAEAGSMPTDTTKAMNVTLKAKQELDYVTKLKGNVMATSLTNEIGDARVSDTTVWPLENDESFYFTFEPLLPHSAEVWKIRYECGTEKRTKVKAAYNIVSNPSNGYTPNDVEYYKKLLDLCDNTHYWCVEEDSNSGKNRFYLCPSIASAGTFQIQFTSTTAGEIFVERSKLMAGSEYDCVGLFSSDKGQQANQLRPGDVPWIERATKAAFENMWPILCVSLIFIVFIAYVKYRLSPHDDGLEELHQRRKYWLSHPAHTSARWTGETRGISALWDKSDMRTRFT